MDDGVSELPLLARHVRHVRALIGATPTALSVGAGLARCLWSLLEGGDKEDPRLSTAKAIADTYAVSLDWLARGVGDPPVAATVRAAAVRAGVELDSDRSLRRLSPPPRKASGTVRAASAAKVA